MNTCPKCKHGRKNIGGVVMCYRPKTMQSGRVLYPGKYGFSPPFETHESSQEDRADGDACGPERKHWEAQ